MANIIEILNRDQRTILSLLIVTKRSTSCLNPHSYKRDLGIFNSCDKCQIKSQHYSHTKTHAKSYLNFMTKSKL